MLFWEFLRVTKRTKLSSQNLLVKAKLFYLIIISCLHRPFWGFLRNVGLKCSFLPPTSQRAVLCLTAAFVEHSFSVSQLHFHKHFSSLNLFSQLIFWIRATAFVAPTTASRVGPVSVIPSFLQCWWHRLRGVDTVGPPWGGGCFKKLSGFFSSILLFSVYKLDVNPVRIRAGLTPRAFKEAQSRPQIWSLPFASSFGTRSFPFQCAHHHGCTYFSGSTYAQSITP